MKHHYSHTVLLVLAIISMIVVLGVYAYMSHAVSTSAASSNNARAAVLAAQSSKSREQIFVQTYQSTASSWARLPTFFISSDKIVSFIEAIEALGPETGATTSLASIDADNLDSASQGTLGAIRAHVDVYGSWTSVMRTLELAEILPFKVSIASVHMEEDQASEKSGRRWKMGFDIKALMIAKIAATSTVSTTSSK